MPVNISALRFSLYNGSMSFIKNSQVNDKIHRAIAIKRQFCKLDTLPHFDKKFKVFLE